MLADYFYVKLLQGYPWDCEMHKVHIMSHS